MPKHWNTIFNITQYCIQSNFQDQNFNVFTKARKHLSDVDVWWRITSAKIEFKAIEADNHEDVFISLFWDIVELIVMAFSTETT